MLIIKVVSLFGVFLSVYKFLKYFGLDKKRKLLELQEYRKILIDIKCEVETFNTPVLKIIEKNFEDFNINFKNFFKQFTESVNNTNNSPRKIFVNLLKLEKNNFNFSNEHFKLFSNFQILLGFLDKIAFLKHINLIIDKVENEIEYLDYNAKNDEILYNKLSILCGLAVVIVFI